MPYQNELINVLRSYFLRQRLELLWNSQVAMYSIAACARITSARGLNNI